MNNVIVVTNNKYGGITETEYKHINKYRITDDFLILEDSNTGDSYYIPKNQVLEFEWNTQV